MLDRFRRSFLTVPVFIRRAYSALEALDGDQYRMRSVAGAKELIEEIIPLVALLIHLEIPDRHIRCRFVGGEQNHDAQIRISGPEVEHGLIEHHYFVEVTSAGSPVDYLQREALTRYGHVFGGGEIHRIGSKRRGDDQIVSRAVAVDGHAAVENAITWIKTRLMAKAAKDYPSPCILAVNVEPERHLSLTEWSVLAREVQGSVDRNRFKLTFVVNWLTNTVFTI
jgi:hypothetical protein